MGRITQIFEEPVVIIASWMVLIIGILGATRLVGAKMPTEGLFGGFGDMFRNT